MPTPLIIAPSILAANFSRLGAEALRAQASGAQWIHVDIMDGHFVPNISFGSNMVSMLRKEVDEIPLDVHLMIERPDRYARDFIEAGADSLTVHIEAKHDVNRTLDLIRNMGCKTGLALNPLTRLDTVLPFLPKVDILLCMTVNPGFGGQAFIGEVLDKVRDAATYIKDHNLTTQIEVDGGINFDTVGPCYAAGANIMVAGTALFAKDDMKAAVEELRARALSVASAG